jgi:hypothetical protein
VKNPKMSKIIMEGNLDDSRKIISWKKRLIVGDTKRCHYGIPPS